MFNPSKGKKACLTIFAVLLIPFALILAGQLRFNGIADQVEKAAKEANPSLTYEVSSVPDSKEDFFQALRDLASWYDSTRMRLDSYFGNDHYMLSWNLEKPDGFADESSIEQYVKIDTWKNMRRTLDGNCQAAVRKIFDGQEERYGVQEHAVEACFPDGVSASIVNAFDDLRDGDGAAAYLAATDWILQTYDDDNGSDTESDGDNVDHKESRSVPMDIVYSMDPELLESCCEQDIQENLQSNSYNEVVHCISRAEYFTDRYGLTIESLDDLRSHQERLQYVMSRRQPEVGMTIDEACLTWLGEPAETSETDYQGKKQSGAPDTHTFGYMYWNNPYGNRIFEAHLLDGVVDYVSDLRQSAQSHSRPSGSYSGGYSSGSSYYSGSDDFDPDDYDLDAYYDDYSDEYDDYDDAVDGLEDDPDRDDYLWD